MPHATFFALPDEKRHRVTSAAVEEFARHPYVAASLDRIAARARIAKGSLYQYFDGKHDIYSWLLLSHLPEAKRAHALVAHEDFFEWLEQSFLAGLRLFEREPDLAALGARAARPTSDAEAQQVHDHLQRLTHEGLCELVRRAQAKSSIRADAPVELAADLIGSLMGTTLLTGLARLVAASLDEVLANPKMLNKVPREICAKHVHDARVLLERAFGAGTPERSTRKPTRRSANKERVTRNR